MSAQPIDFRFLETPRLVGRPVVPRDRELVRTILEENAKISSSVSGEQDTDKAARAFVERADLPPGGDAANLRHFILEHRDDDRPVGFLGLYLGYPDAATYYVGNLFLRKADQRCGFGREVIKEVERVLASSGFSRGRVGVALRNWGGLRFWTAMGYDRVTKISGDAEFGEGRHACLELEKDSTP